MYEKELEKCVALLDIHWPSSMSCNGLLQVSGHLNNVLIDLQAKDKEIERLRRTVIEAQKHLNVINLDYGNMMGRTEIIFSIEKAKEFLKAALNKKGSE